ncbi:VOC family protein [Streptomyces montanisoli]|uniref:VOC family protein n=1 Tax=Streptomyces montanisoli TaxID=2798581 RepID=A0A940MEH8_9ACTN|nr:VOC family protein [Streptomyces montanisoli]MBP0457203.1 VOC family protein [Streptomyces montanisoli]
MPASPKFAHVVFQTGQPQEMRDWYCTVLDGHVVYQDDALSFVTFDEEHHRVALIHPPVPLSRKAPGTAAMHHVAYTFESVDDLLERYVLLRDQGVRPAVCIAHGVTTSMYYRDPDGNMVELQIDRFAEPDDATAYMKGPEYAADSVGPAFDPEALLEARRGGATVEELSDRAWALGADLPDPMPVLMGGGA